MIFHFSDFSGRHIAYIDWKADKTDPMHPSSVLKREFEKNEDLIIEQTRIVKTRDIPSSYLQEFFRPLDIIGHYYMDASKFDFDDLRRAQARIMHIAQKFDFKVLYSIYSMIAATYVSKTKEIRRDFTEISDYLNSAIEIYQEILESLSIKDNPSIYVDTQKKVGDIYLKLSEYQDRKKNCGRAIGAYEEALKIYTLDDFPIDYAFVQNNLGAAYETLAEIEDKAKNCKKAIKACEEALRIRTPKDFPMWYATTQNKLGVVYHTLTEIEDTIENCKKAIKAYEKALKVNTLDDFPMQYAATQNNLGNAYNTLVRVAKKTENCKKAIEAYEKALKIYKSEKFPEIHQELELNIRMLLDFCEDE
ncbi:MAG: tetratricopeptide repeat protein [Theionarchaea archaeon]|nr:tetratricopeptide repeat protein [Theionarchaea archaeon]